MPKLQFVAKHRFTVPEAKARFEQLLQKFSNLAEVTATWTGDDYAKLEGKRASGELRLAGDSLQLSLELSFFLSALKGTIKDRVAQELTNAGFSLVT